MFKFSLLAILFYSTFNLNAQQFTGKAYYATKSSLEFGQWGNSLSTEQKKQIKERLKNRLEKSYVLTFNKEESFYEEEDKLDAISGATDTWGKNFAQGEQYKNVKNNELVQEQEFYGKKFLVKDKLLELKWNMSGETKSIGDYMCFKATASVPYEELTWYNFSWDKLRNSQSEENQNQPNEESENSKMVEIEAWYTPQVPVSHGPSEFWGLPGLILQVSTEDTTVLCTRIIMNTKEDKEIEAPRKGEEVSKAEYQEIIVGKMAEMRDMYRGRRR